MKRLILSVVLAAIFLTNPQTIQAQTAPAIQWDKTFGTSVADRLYFIRQTKDGGYILGGETQSGISGDKTEITRGLSDFWIVKTDSLGNKLWDKTIGGNGDDLLQSIIQTSDGGYLLGGSSDSGISGEKTQLSKGQQDYWIVKIDAFGNKLWDKSFGGNSGDVFKEFKQTSDGGYIMGGFSYSDISGDKTEINKGLADYWVIKLDSSGYKIWDKTFGGTMGDYLEDLQQTADGGYILGGSSHSGISTDKTQPSKGDSDYWIIKLDGSGNKTWDRTFGGGRTDEFASLKQTTDGGYILGGTSNSDSSGDKTQANPNPGTWNFWVLKLNNTGNIIWDKTVGGIPGEHFSNILQTSDGGYILSGESASGISGDKTQPTKGSLDMWIVKLAPNGSIVWDKGIGTSGTDLLSSLQQTRDGGYILGGSSWAGISGDKTQPSMGNLDYWIVKLDASCNALNASIRVGCNGNTANVIADISGLPGLTGIIPWTITYSINGVMQTVTGSSQTVVLSQNAIPGHVFILVKIAAGSCIINLNKILTVPIIPITPQVRSGYACGPSLIVLSATGAPTYGSYVWYDSLIGGTLVYTDSSETFTTPILTNTTTYYVAIVTNEGCEGPRAPITATINQINVSAGLNDTICTTSPPFQLNGFKPTGGAWSGPGVSSNGIFTPSRALLGSNTITYSVNSDSCTFTSTKEVVVKESVSLGPDQTGCEGQFVTLVPNYTSGLFVWSDGSRNPTLLVNQPGRYWVEHLHNNCITTDTIQISFKPCPKPSATNIITLNGDGLNETFIPINMKAGKLQLQIYNRWGVLIYESKDYKNIWPNKDVIDGTYYYLLQNLDSKQSLKGWVEVMH